MKATEIKEKNREELNEMLASLKEERFNLKMQKSIGQMQNSSRIGAVKKDIARIKTILTEKNNKG